MTWYRDGDDAENEDQETAEGGPDAQQMQVGHTDSKEANDSTSHYNPFCQGEVLFRVVQLKHPLHHMRCMFNDINDIKYRDVLKSGSCLLALCQTCCFQQVHQSEPGKQKTGQCGIQAGSYKFCHACALKVPVPNGKIRAWCADKRTWLQSLNSAELGTAAVPRWKGKRCA